MVIFLRTLLVFSACANSSCLSAKELPIEFGFQNLDAGPIVSIEIGEAKKLSALLDTGSSTCVISPDTAKKIIATRNEPIGNNLAKIHGFGDTELYTKIDNVQIKINQGNYRRNLVCFVPSKEEDRSAVDIFFANSGIDVILGLDFFKGTEVTIDSINSIAKIKKIAPSITDIRSAKVGKIPIGNELYYDIQIKNEKFSVILDTGFSFESNLVFYDRASTRVEKTAPGAVYDTTSFSTFSSSLLKRTIRPVQLNLPLSNLETEVLVSYGATELQPTRMGNQRNDGYMGWGILRKGVASFNLIGTPTDWSSDFKVFGEINTKYNKSGFAAFSRTADLNLLVKKFKNISPAQESGFRIGDIIKQINGIPVNSELFSIKLMKDAFSGSGGNTVPILVNRNGRDMVIELELRDFLRDAP